MHILDKLRLRASTPRVRQSFNTFHGVAHSSYFILGAIHYEGLLSLTCWTCAGFLLVAVLVFEE